jgi:signal transduction histidine kinase
MRGQRATNLRTVLSVAGALVTMLAITSALALVLATSAVQRMTSRVAGAVESVRAVEEAQVALLLHVRALGRGEPSDYADQVGDLLDQAGQHVASADQAAAHALAKSQVGAYLALAHGSEASPEQIRAQEVRAIDALDQLGDLDVAHARAARDRANRWNRFANIAGVVLGVSIVGVTTVLVLWLRRRVVRPLFALADTMKRFGEGQRTVRAAEQGPTELREMTQRFNEMADALAKQRDAQVAFLGGVAHDLRNPLGALKLAVDSIAPDEPLPPEPQLRRMLAIIHRQIGHLDRMVTDFLDITKIEAGKLELEVGEHDLRDIVAGAAELFTAAERERFAVTMPDHPVAVRCDATRIGQAITNLFSNALKYSPPNVPIELTVREHADDVTIAVTDHGVGIPREDLQRIFEPFRRGATRSTVPGTGLGLYNVRRIVHAHAGRIDVESVPAVGSTFRIHLPRQAAGEPVRATA